MLDVDGQMRISIIDKNATEQEKSVWGNTGRMGSNEYFILIDSSMWRKNGLCHELIHAFDNNHLNKISRSDSAYYFFAESLVEYLSIYLRYDDPRKRDIEFCNGLLSYIRNNQQSSSVMGLTDNGWDKSGSGTSCIIYQKTPFVIHCFAKRIGEKRFIRIFKDFYRQAKDKNKVSMSDFESVAKQRGVTDKEWKWFIRYL